MTNVPSNFLKFVCAQNFVCATFHQDSSIFRTTFIHSGHFYSAPLSPLHLRGAPDYSTDRPTVSESHA